MWGFSAAGSWLDAFIALLNLSIDKRLDGLPLMRSDHVVAAITAYLLLIAVLRACTSQQTKSTALVPPSCLRGFSIVYNFLMALFSLILTSETLRQAFVVNHFSFLGNVDDRSSPRTMGLAYCVYAFYMSKLAEWVDTVQIVLRGNARQLSFLHMYHHSTVLIVAYISSHAASQEARRTCPSCSTRWCTSSCTPTTCGVQPPR